MSEWNFALEPDYLVTNREYLIPIDLTTSVRADQIRGKRSREILSGMTRETKKRRIDV